MKKGATLTSGILTIILFVIISFVSVFQIANIFEISTIQSLLDGLEDIYYAIVFIGDIFVVFPVLFASILIENLETEMVLKVVSIVFAAFSLFMVFWGIKEILISKKDDLKFAKSKKTCGFMMFTKFMFFAFLAASVILFFINKEYQLLCDLYIVAPVKDFKGVDLSNALTISLIIAAVYALIIFLLPAINFAVASKKVIEEDLYLNESQKTNQNEPVANDNAQGGKVYSSQSTMQANMPPIPGYQPQYNTQSQAQQQAQPQNQVDNTPKPIYAETQPQPSVQAQFNPQVQAEEELRASSITPGINGVPLNITQKGIEGLERLERLRAGGMLTEANYQTMRQKIFTTEIE